MRLLSTLTAFSLIVGYALQASAQGKIITCVAKPQEFPSPPYISRTTFEFKTNQVLTVVGATGDSKYGAGDVELHFGNGGIVRGGSSATISIESPLKLGYSYTGLTKIVVNNNTSSAYAFTVSVSEPGTEPQTVPSGTVVIPTDSVGPVRIILESSTDLVNWAEANPGTYAKDNPRRFFRVRAVNQ
jgi:hypothetical protein